MFNALASLLLGGSQETAGGVEESNVRLTSVLSEDDWVMVDRDSEGNSEVESNASEENVDECDLNNQSRLPTLLTRSSSTSSLPCTIMEESWFVTPPPCFTSAGPIHMETSPLENLLIEHPSMSVYQHSQPALIARRHNSAPTQSVSEDTDFVDDEEVQEILQQVPLQRVEEVQVIRYRERDVPVRHRNRVEALQLEEKQKLKCKQAQKVQIQRACQSLKRRYLERNNKAREVNCRNRRQRRGERSQGATRSYANNNRKC